MLPNRLQKYDYRANLTIDQDNPVLIQKAWRDRFSAQSHWDAGYGGHAYLSRTNSEDALTWNVFRTLQLAGEHGLEILSRVFQLSGVTRILFWGCDVEHRGEEQQILNILIRTIDGRHRGTMTEPDLVIVTDEEVAFVESKLNQTGRRSPWRTTAKGSAKRFRTYLDRYPELAVLTNWREVYQLVRQYVYARSLAEHLEKTPKVVALINKDHEAILSPYYSNLRERLETDIHVFDDFVTWQDVSAAIDASRLSNKDAIVAKMEETLAAAR